eukprot:Pgem_evm1s11569
MSVPATDNNDNNTVSNIIFDKEHYDNDIYSDRYSVDQSMADSQSFSPYMARSDSIMKLIYNNNYNDDTSINKINNHSSNPDPDDDSDNSKTRESNNDNNSKFYEDVILLLKKMQKQSYDVGIGNDNSKIDNS